MKIVVNDILFKSKYKYSKKGFISNFNTLVKNLNVDAKKSAKYKDKFEQSLSTIFQYNAQLPLTKENSEFTSNLTPKLMLMYSPNKTKNLSEDKKRIDATKIFSFNRLDNNETVEGGGSLTYGISYNKTSNKNNEEILKLDLSSLIRNKKNLDLPKTSTLGNKKSDIFGNFEIYPNKNFSLGYRFALDDKLNKSNYDSLSTTF